MADTGTVHDTPPSSADRLAAANGVLACSFKIASPLMVTIGATDATARSTVSLIGGSVCGSSFRADSLTGV
jgi:hypothetical protein